MSTRQSDNYVWSVTELIGQGATGNVFICRDKVQLKVSPTLHFDFCFVYALVITSMVAVYILSSQLNKSIKNDIVFRYISSLLLIFLVINLYF